MPVLQGKAQQSFRPCRFYTEKESFPTPKLVTEASRADGAKKALYPCCRPH